MARRARAIAGLVATCTAIGLLASAPGALAKAPPPEDVTLALLYRPHLLFDAKERWRPIDVDRFLAEPGHAVCPPLDGPCTPLTSIAQLTSAVDHLDLRGTRGDGSDATAPDVATCAKSLPALRDCDKRGRSVIYAHVTRERSRIAIDYWWFLRYNAFTLDRHEGDWEGVTVILDRTGTQVRDVHFAAHSDVWRYAGDTPQLRGNHIKVYVARGSHAAYPGPCRRLCRETSGLLPEAHFGGERSWVGNTEAGCRDRCVRLFPATVPAATPLPPSWDTWEGRWGVTLAPAFAAPLTPAFQRRYGRPFSARHTGRYTF